MQRSKFAVAAATLAALSLTACGSSESAQGEYDVSAIKADEAVVKLVPKAIKDKGVLENGAAADYAPAEFRKEDGQTLTGYEVDLVKALGKVMGLEGRSTHEPFENLLPKIGSKFDIEASSFTINNERLKQVDMVAYLNVGFRYGVAKGNPSKFDPKNPCGRTVGVQRGTAQEESIADISKKLCESQGKPKIEVKPHQAQTEITQKVVGGQYDATLADEPVIGYAVKKTDGKLEAVGEIFDAAKQGIVVSKDNPELAKAILAALEKLKETGELQKIFAHWGAENSLLDKFEINPKVD